MIINSEDEAWASHFENDVLCPKSNLYCLDYDTYLGELLRTLVWSNIEYSGPNIMILLFVNINGKLQC